MRFNLRNSGDGVAVQRVLRVPDWLSPTRENSKLSSNQSETLHGSLYSYVIILEFWQRLGLLLSGKTAVELISNIRDILAVHVFVIDHLFGSLAGDDPAETKANKHNEDRDHE